MKPWMLILVLLLIHEAQGIRLLTKETPSVGQNIVFKTFQGTRNDIGVEEAILYHSSGSWLRKLLVSPISSTTTIAKSQKDKNKEKNSRKKDNLPVDSSSTTVHQRPTAPETYPSILDIAGMDYSQARRKPPIHN